MLLFIIHHYMKIHMYKSKLSSTETTVTKVFIHLTNKVLCVKKLMHITNSYINNFFYSFIFEFIFMQI